MKITSIQLRIEEEDYELYEEEMLKNGWSKLGDQHVYRKKFGETEVEVKEHVPTFSPDVTLLVTARNEKGIPFDRLTTMLEELRKLDKTEDRPS